MPQIPIEQELNEVFPSSADGEFSISYENIIKNTGNVTDLAKAIICDIISCSRIPHHGMGETFGFKRNKIFIKLKNSEFIINKNYKCLRVSFNFFLKLS